MTLVNTEAGEVVPTLESCEEVIERGFSAFVEVGNALLTIRDAKLYRSQHDTFESYCSKRWGLKRQRAYELIDAAKVVGVLSEISDTPLPERESHAAALSPLLGDPAAAAEAMQAAVQKSAGKPTAKDVKQAVELTITQKRAVAVTKYPWLDVVAPAQQIISTAEALDKYTGKELDQRIETSKKWAAAQQRKQSAPPKPDTTAAERDIEQALDTLVRFNVEAERAERALSEHPHLLDDSFEEWTAAITSARQHLDDLTPVPGLRRVK